ncbi:OBAP family protein [Robbsia sp. Bb-Pol-6]|uniref:OBAP family protein n=1 Tax=Robbsia betulipollinis TaxID=2981849 RepID=A0ABT3ZKE8_9BURK|nr:OBAP family protein [Robbsia betulipollinis]MCY0387011.1 OBAP family protein [Robbsia betulipollinis]
MSDDHTDDCVCRRRFNTTLVKSALALPLAGLFSRLAGAQQTPAAPLPAASTSGPTSLHSKMLDTGADALQSKKPIDAMSEYLNGFHFYADDMGRQVEANHFCTHLSEDFHQCVIYDANHAHAKLIGIEYIVSERVFKTLPAEEKRLWHSHHYEVKSGELVAPRVPDLAEHAFMKDLVTTYGKTWHTWQIDRDKTFPFGIPQLMMGFTQDGQANPAMVQNRDERFHVSAAAQKKNRADIPMPTVDPGANAWQSGKTVQLTLIEVPVKNLKKT